MGEKVIRINWENPLDKKAYAEIGQLMVLIFPHIKEILVSDNEGVIIKVEIPDQEDLSVLNEYFRYVYVDIEGEEEMNVEEEEEIS